MKRIRFCVLSFPLFHKWVTTTSSLTWDEDFIDAGFKSAVREGYCLYSLSEEEYTIFVLKWS
jgi:hypothetical protein